MNKLLSLTELCYINSSLLLLLFNIGFCSHTYTQQSLLSVNNSPGRPKKRVWLLVNSYHFIQLNGLLNGPICEI